MIKFIKQLFCWHDYIRTDNEPLPIPKKGEIINCIREHKCRKCGLTSMIGSGWIT